MARHSDQILWIGQVVRKLKWTHTHRDTHAHTRAHARTQTHALTQTHTRTLTRTHTLTRAHTHSRTHTDTHTHARAHTHGMVITKVQSPPASVKNCKALAGNWEWGFGHIQKLDRSVHAITTVGLTYLISTELILRYLWILCIRFTVGIRKQKKYYTEDRISHKTCNQIWINGFCSWMSDLVNVEQAPVNYHART
jgi:hypothetical protein